MTAGEKAIRMLLSLLVLPAALAFAILIGVAIWAEENSRRIVRGWQSAR